jgi:hypothetical protein
MLKSKSIFATILLFGIMYFLFSLSSCDKENVITPPPNPPPDTASRFIWTMSNYMPYGFFYLYVADSTHIYIGGVAEYFFNGTNFSVIDYQDPDYINNIIRGYDKDNIFFIGYRNGTSLNPTIKKLSNGIFSTYTLDTTGYAAVDLIVTDKNKAWITSQHIPRVYFFDNGNITKYALTNIDTSSPSSYTFVRILKDKFNDIYTFCYYLEKDSMKVNTYKFNGTDFLFIKKNCYGSNNGCNWECFYKIGQDYIMWSYYELYYFNQGNWEFLCNTVPQVFPFVFGGWSKDSIVCLYNQHPSIYIYNGLNWRKENIPFILPVTSGIDHSYGDTYNGSIYLPVTNIGPSLSYLLIGRPKK